MNQKNLRVGLLLLLSMVGASGMAQHPLEQCVRRVTLDGYVGSRYRDCMEKRVKPENIDTLISVFRSQDEVREQWGSEFWGKWVQGAIGMYRYTQDEELGKLIQHSQDMLISCQLADGYIGDYDKEHQLTGWDVWGRKYTLLGLIRWYQVSGNKSSLRAATRLMDYTIRQVGPAGKSIYACGLYKGMPPMSILEPTMFLYRITRDRRYLDFAQYIVSAGEEPDGPQLIGKSDIEVSRRWVTTPEFWWHARNGQKAYEMMSCYVGMLELYRETGDERLLEAACKACRHIMDEEINICGSGASFECWYGGKEQQHRVAMHTMETCVTFTWMQFCERLLEFTGNPLYADQLEKTMYNALLSAFKGDGSQIAQYTPMEGYRQEGERQCDIPINCCNANGPRAFALIPRVQYRLPAADRLDINLYIPSTAQILIGKHPVTITQTTDYPLSGQVDIAVQPQRTVSFTLALRIPEWSRENRVWVNGEAVDGVKSGSYCCIQRIWQPGDRVTVSMQMQARVVEQQHMQAIERGPIVLARDSRFGDGYVDESCVIPRRDGNWVDLEPVPDPAGMWMAFRLRMLRGAYDEKESEKEITYFCDFASAGSTWDRSVRYRVWLPRTLNARYDKR